ncbi:MAG: Aspartyl/glutamyl-tRNA(Asn/Gln) amidotransferase subunit B [candidate division TM6 bacterium GW2011_GWF2_37_49]|nr:MAG: Aspartyl/glutamyl-tRNA(Asn/Gln) amidotransferase subunit B [candidate division TM6 bacterium GW2011_GWF2_37_49]
MSEQARSQINTHNYEATIGIEVHCQLKTKSKIFCGCKNEFTHTPNKNICQVCSGQPGVLPILNKKVVDYAIMLGLATNCKIAQKTDFARKHYFYPDLPKNYQITQDLNPICEDGFIQIELEDGSDKQIRLIRIHIEEDAGKNHHTDAGYSLVDINRAGTPLVEIVSHPDMKSSYEARAYVMRLHSIIKYLGISDANMEEGSFRADVNISVKKKTDAKLGQRVELKNINSFKFIGQAIDYEIERQIQELESGEKIYQETRLWDRKNQKTIVMRRKEGADDYRYFPEPDLPEIDIDKDWIECINKTIPELPGARIKRFQADFALPYNDALILIEDLQLASFFEECCKFSKHSKTLSNWILRNLLAYLKEHNTEISKTKITAQLLGELVNAIESGDINNKVAQDVFAEMIETGKSPAEIIKDNGLRQIDSVGDLEAIAKKIIEANPSEVEKYKAGNVRLFGFFVGQAMKETQGKANPKLLNDIFQKLLS